MPQTIIIAEIGENHIGDMNIAKGLIREAASAGADYVKFQSYTPETFKKEDAEYEWFKKVSLSNENHFMLKGYAEECGVKFLSSPFSVERAKFLCEKLGLKDIKIASGVMLNFSLLDYINEYADTVFLSTGMATVAEIRKAVARLNKVKECFILHCVTQYPCKDEDANLLAIKALQKEFPHCPIGYSDHTFGYLAATIAVALGARVIEKHFTFDRKHKEGTDHGFSLEFTELQNMIQAIHRIELMLGSGQKLPGDAEKKIIDFVRNRFVS